MSEIYYRKIVRLGKGNTLAMCLPIGYCRNYDIKKGDTVKVVTTNLIVIKPIKEEGWKQFLV